MFTYITPLVNKTKENRRLNFNNTIKNWYIQIYDELIRDHEVLPENFNGPTKRDRLVNLNALENIVKDNNNIDLNFDFYFMGQY